MKGGLDMEENIVDNILESFVKLGKADTPISFYYPISSLLGLLDCDKDHLNVAIDEFKKEMVNSLGDITIKELAYEKDRYEVRIPLKGVRWVRENYKPTPFTEEFIKIIQKPNQSIEEVLKVFNAFSQDIIVDELKSGTLAVSFKDKMIDKYVYLIEQNEFGLQYHRFTQKEYLNLIGEAI